MRKRVESAPCDSNLLYRYKNVYPTVYTVTLVSLYSILVLACLKRRTRKFSTLLLDLGGL
jgi:hypothetical protein